MVKMKAVDTMHVSSVGPDNIMPGATFDVNETEAALLEKMGHAKRVGGKAEPAPDNKMEAAPENKGIISAASVKAPAKRKAAK